MKKIVYILLLFLSLLSVQAMAQVRISGKITDEKDNQPLSGVTIKVKGTSTGTVSDLNGNYSISVQNADAVLVFSYTGYTSQESKAGPGAVLNIQLSSKSSALNEVVVI